MRDLRRRRTGARGAAALAAALAAAILVLAACGRPAEPPRPWLLIGIDGAEWRVIERLWSAGRLPHMRALAERGVRAVLRTDYGISPVIWTTIATGRKPRDHGITDFVVATDRGDLPVSSALRQVPALWNMATTAGKRVGVVGWWATWPAESIAGPMISDRALHEAEAAVSPPTFLPVFEEVRRQAEGGVRLFAGPDIASRRDELAWRLGEQLARERLDLLLVYFRAVDIVSHNSWKYFEPESFPGLDPAAFALHREEIPQAYDATDAALGRLLAAAGSEANVLLISDHGFRATRREEVQVFFDLDAVLERLGYLRRGPHGVSFAESRAYSYDSPPHQRLKKVRFALAGRQPNGKVPPGKRAALAKRLTADLLSLRYASGKPALAVREPGPRQLQAGVDLLVEVRLDGIGEEVLWGGEPVPGAISHLGRISGTHGRSTHGIFLAAGPDIDPQANLDGISIHDVAPTVLYGLGLPLGQDFSGEARLGLFRRGLRGSRPVRRIASWGRMPAKVGPASTADSEILEELRALGYLN